MDELLLIEIEIYYLYQNDIADDYKKIQILYDYLIGGR